VKKYYEVHSESGVETRRTDRNVAEADVSILRWLGKKAHIVEVES
jgi:hypothetical protein